MFRLLTFILPILSAAAYSQLVSGVSPLESRGDLRYSKVLRRPAHLAHLSRQATSGDCGTPCDALSAAISADGDDDLVALCTNTVGADYQACYSCHVTAGDLTQQEAQDTVDAFTQGCSADGHPVNAITISADGSSTGGDTSSDTQQQPTDGSTETAGSSPEPSASGSSGVSGASSKTSAASPKAPGTSSKTSGASSKATGASAPSSSKTSGSARVTAGLMGATSAAMLISAFARWG
ncbi:hypothetical protein FB451DRAFT_1556818 [Mycena latifolia]|nr:hypothetical protein FB451DRAFT_1556818 [Mycena latifolia]